MRHIIATTTMATLLTATFAGCLDDGDDHEHIDDAALSISGSDADVAAACAQFPKKQAVCHIPPGNPANAHTICISVNAVDKHLSLHGDYLGACDPGSGGGGQGGDPTSGAGGADSGSGGATSGAGGGGVCSEEYPPCTTTADCDVAQSECVNGCCVPYTY